MATKAERETSLLWQRYEHAVAYQAALGMNVLIPRYVDFYEGRQWPPATAATKSLPRPVINIVKMICRNKKAAILTTPVRCIYKSDTDEEVSALNDFALYIDKELGQERIDREAVDSGVKKGTAIYHYYWDAEGRGFDGVADGALRCELCDPLRTFFADPTEPDEQKQAWIMFASREPVEAVRAKADKGVDIEQIVKDDSDDPYGREEQEGTELCTVLTCYFRRGGEVYVEKAVKACTFQAARPLTPDKGAARRMMDEADVEKPVEKEEARAEAAAHDGGERGEAADPANTGMPDTNETRATAAVQAARSYLYPVVVWRYEPRERSIYGLSEVEGLIPNQKAINFMYAMLLLNVQQLAWGKWQVLPNALKNQRITNEPGQVLTDWTKTGNGIKPLNGPALQGQPLTIAQELMSATRVVTGSTEVMTGETLGASMSGAAIAQLQSQAQMPSEDARNGFWLCKERQGKVKEQFFKTFYTGEKYVKREVTDKLTPDGDPVEARSVQVFNSDDWAGRALDVICEATTGTKASAAGDVQILEAAYTKGDIDFMTLLMAYPKDALGNRTEILRAMRARENSEYVAAQTQLMQLQAQLEQLAQTVAEDEKSLEAVRSLIAENKSLQEMLAQVKAQELALEKEARDKLNAANAQIVAGNMAIQDARNDAATFARQLAALGGLLPAGGAANEMPEV